MGFCISHSSPKKQNQVGQIQIQIRLDQIIIFIHWFTRLQRLRSPKIFRLSWQLGTQGGRLFSCSLKDEASRCRKSWCFSLSPSTDWMRPTHVRESNLLYSVCEFKYLSHPKTPSHETSLVAQWLRIRLPMQGKQVRALVWEDPHAVEQLSPHTTTTEPALQSPQATTTDACAPRARAPQQEKPLQ